MKRSEILDIIYGILIDHEVSVLQGISKEILSQVEFAGMSPPERCYDYIYNNQKYTVFSSSWEPENS